jgi:predicted extracellular nuclease
MRLLMLMIFLLRCCSGQTTVVHELRIATYNVENLFDIYDAPGKRDGDFTPAGSKNWDFQRYAQKQANIATVIADLDADIVALSEVENRLVLEELIRQEALREEQYKIVHFDSPDRRGIDNALLYRADAFRLLGSEQQELDLSRAGGGPTRDILLVWGQVNNGDTLLLAVNHWPSRYGGVQQSEAKRLLAAQRLRQTVDSLAVMHPEWAMLLLGDFNDTPVNRSIREILGVASAPEDSSFLYNSSMFLTPDAGSYNYRGKWFLYDQIIVSRHLMQDRGVVLARESVRVFTAPYLLQKEGQYSGYPWRTYAGKHYLGGYSDHLPLLLEILLYGASR